MPQSVSGKLKLSRNFPSPDEVKSVVSKRMPKKHNMTEKAVLCVLRHKFTNYDDLLHTHIYEHDSLKEAVNNIILQEIKGWNDD